jgi:hypothetical protein
MRAGLGCEAMRSATALGEAGPGPDMRPGQASSSGGKRKCAGGRGGQRVGGQGARMQRGLPV